MNYQTAVARVGRKVANNTRLEARPGSGVALRLHQTDVVTFYPDFVTLNSGGWHTATTKDRINEWSPTRVSQRKFEWFMPDGTPFYDGMRVRYDGSIIPRQTA